MAQIANIGEPPIEPPIPGPITEEEAIAFFNDRASGYTCAICGSDSFDYFSNNDKSAALGQVFIGEIPGGRPRGYVASLVFHCSECGHMILFHWHSVRKWLDERIGLGS